MLVIEYVHEGHQRGYNFTSPTHSYDDAALKLIWRNAMPRGQGWGAEMYAGARSLKCFPLDSYQVAVSQVTVTDEVDDAGRRGIRRAEIEVLKHSAYLQFLRQRLADYSPVVRSTAERMLTICQRTRIIEKTLPRFRKESQLILVHDYTSPAAWQVIEAVAIKLALYPVVPMRRWSAPIPLTTLALDYRDEGRIIAIPAEKSAQVDVPFVALK